MQILLFILSALNLSGGAAPAPGVIVKNEAAIVSYFNSHQVVLTAQYGTGQVQQFEHLMSLIDAGSNGTGSGNNGGNSTGGGN